MSENAILFSLYRMGYRGRMTGHGFRGLASTWLREAQFPHDVVERQLAHIVKDRTEAAYNHSQLASQRREMMQRWSDTLDAMTNENARGNPIPLPAGRRKRST